MSSSGTSSSSENERSILRSGWPGAKPRPPPARPGRAPAAPASPPRCWSGCRALLAPLVTRHGDADQRRRPPRPRPRPASRRRRDRGRRRTARPPHGVRLAREAPLARGRPAAPANAGSGSGAVGAQRQRQLLQLAGAAGRRASPPRSSSAASTAARSRSSRWRQSSQAFRSLVSVRWRRVEAAVSDSLEHARDLRVREPARELERDQVALVAVERAQRGAHGLAPQRQLGVVVGTGRLGVRAARPPCGRGACAGAARRALRCGRSRTARPPGSRAAAGSRRRLR